MMKSLLITLVAISCALILPQTAQAYSETPWENAKVGEMRTYQCWVARFDAKGSSYLVTVICGCNSGYTAYLATAKEGSVPDDLLGKPAQVTAKVAHKSEDGRFLMLELERVEKIAEK